MGYQMTKEKKTDSKYNTKDLFFDRCDYSVWSENEEELADKEESEDLPLMLPLEEGERLKTFNFQTNY